MSAADSRGLGGLPNNGQRSVNGESRGTTTKPTVKRLLNDRPEKMPSELQGDYDRLDRLGFDPSFIDDPEVPSVLPLPKRKTVASEPLAETSPVPTRQTSTRPCPFVESARSRGLTPPIGPYLITKPRVLYRELGETVHRPETSQTPSARDPDPDRVYTARNINFDKNYTYESNPIAKIANRESMDEILRVGKFLQEHPQLHVEVRASVGLDFSASFFRRHPSLTPYPPSDDRLFKVMDARARAVSQIFEALGVARARIHSAHGKIGKGEDDRVVEFTFKVPSR